MSQQSKKGDDNEVDLSEISKKIGQSYENFLSWIFGGFLFVKRNLIILIVLLVIGVGLGIYLDETSETYDNEIIIAPNFNSTQYAYATVKLINSKIKEHDSVFLKSIGIKNPRHFTNIEIKPVTEIYSFIGSKKENFDLIKLMAEDGEINKIIEDETTSMNYPSHRLIISSREKEGREAIIDPVMNFMNSNNYYKIMQESTLQSLAMKINANENTVSQIDSLLHKFSDNTKQSRKADQMFYYNENTQLNDVLQTKNGLIQDLANKKIELLNSDKIVKERSAILNIKNTASLHGKLKLILPVIFIVLFVLWVFLRNFYKRQSEKLKNS
jgi:hypothetical protein